MVELKKFLKKTIAYNGFFSETIDHSIVLKKWPSLWSIIWWVYRLVENVPSPLWPNYMTNLCICIYRWWILHGGNVTVSYSHPLWHISTRWQYDWWELAGRMMMMMRASMRRQIFVKKHTLAKLLWTSGVTCCFAKQQHSNLFLLLSLCFNENIALAVSVRSTREYYKCQFGKIVRGKSCSKADMLEARVTNMVQVTEEEMPCFSKSSWKLQIAEESGNWGENVCFALVVKAVSDQTLLFNI